MVYNEGFPGDTTRELLSRFSDSVTVHHPELVILWCGINDMLYCGHTLPPEDFRKNFCNLVRRCRAEGAAVLAGNTIPNIREYLLEQFPGIAEFPETPETRLAIADEIIEQICSDETVPLADLRGVVSSLPVGECPESFLRNEANSGRRDGLHLTSPGYAAVAAAFYSQIDRHHLPHGSVVCYGDSLTYGVYVRGKGKALPFPEGETYPSHLAARLAD